LNYKAFYTFSSLILLILFSFSFLTACDESDSARQVNRPDISDPSDADAPISTPADSNPIDGNDTPGAGSTPLGGGGGGGGGTAGDDDDDVVIGDVDTPDNPNPPETGTGEIRGSVVSSSFAPLNAVHVRAVNVDDQNIQISAFSGIGCNLSLMNGEFCIQNIPPGTYRILIEKLDARNEAFNTAFNRYSDFVSDELPALSFPDEYWNDTNESSTDNVMEVETVVVSDGDVVMDIDFITNDGP